MVSYCSSNEPVHGWLTSEQCHVCRSDLVLDYGSVCVASPHCVANGHISPDITVPVSNNIDIALVAVVPLVPPLNNAAPALADCSTATRLLGIKSLQCVARTRPVLSLSGALHKAPPQSSSPIIYSLSKSSITLKTKSQIGKQLYGSDRPCLDFSTDLHMMLCNQLRQKVISRLRPCSETRPMLAPPGWQYQYWLQWQVGLVFVTLPLFSHTILLPCSTPQFIYPLPLTSSSRRPPYLRYQRKYLHRRQVSVKATEKNFLVSTICSFTTRIVGPPRKFQ